MRFSQAISAVFAAFVAAVWIGAGVAAAEPAARPVSYKAPIVASLSTDEDGVSSRPAPLRDRARTRTGAVLDSPGAQLATTAAVFVLAMFLASLASKRS